ncbi:hypothetical protein LF41_2419 [Lysobacter dokdonensis DS-58]|uniref:Uncharacterized protein n=1 Tax=Lysobacter dokdonensis DS-58 TaxID=1300345 RepID=A0A0A2WME8_9GAMM|nr:hypothetical protein LF41_2419 [Lysobacter dokdonensis DS-58]
MKRNASWLLICGLALCGCKSVGPVVCPTLPPPPPSVMQPPETEKKVRRELFVQPETPTTKSAPSKRL